MAPRLTLSLVERPADDAAILDVLSSSTFPFHVDSAPTRKQAQDAIDRGRFDGPDRLPFWVLADGERIGMATLEDVADTTLMIDVRLAEHARGHGHGAEVLRLLADEAFRRCMGAIRIEGITRADNSAMRRTFRRAGWVKEAHHRSAWPAADGTLMDAVTYAILRRDWSTGETTPVAWADEPVPRRGPVTRCCLSCAPAFPTSGSSGRLPS